MNRKPAGQHSPLSRAPLDSEDFTSYFHRKTTDVIRNSFKINFEYDTRTNWRAVWRKYKSAMLADVAAAPLPLVGLSVPVGPAKCDRCLQ